MEPKFTYLLINFLTILYPIAQSFEHRLRFYKKWFALYPAISLTAVFFIIWDVGKTYYGVWSFNPNYLIGINLINLPLEEWLFFLTVPYACVFIYEVMNYYVKMDLFHRYANNLSSILGFILIICAIIFYDKAYTFIIFTFQGIYLIILAYKFKPKWLGRFYLAYFVSLIPFAIVNGVLTSLPVVMYNSSEIIGIRLYSIPIEDTIYSMMLILMNIQLYEHFLSKRGKFIQ